MKIYEYHERQGEILCEMKSLKAKIECLRDHPDQYPEMREELEKALGHLEQARQWVATSSTTLAAKGVALGME